MRFSRRFLALFLGVVWVGLCGLPVRAQQQPKPPSKFDLEKARVMLSAIKEDVRKNYYDPNYRGMDLEASFKTADEKFKTATGYFRHSMGKKLPACSGVIVTPSNEAA